MLERAFLDKLLNIISATYTVNTLLHSTTPEASILRDPGMIFMNLNMVLYVPRI